MAATRLDVVAAAPWVRRRIAGEIVATGPGWGWVRTPQTSVHLTDRFGVHGPLSLTLAEIPQLPAGTSIVADATAAMLRDTPALPPPAPAAEILMLADSLTPHGWVDAVADRLGREPLEGVLPHLIGRGEGLTPAGDDALCGYMAAWYACDTGVAFGHGQRVLANLGLTGEPSRSLLRAAATDGAVFAPATAMLRALLRADTAAAPSALRSLVAIGHSSGRALLHGLVSGLREALTP